jgi:hypothetical protein
MKMLLGVSLSPVKVNGTTFTYNMTTENATVMDPQNKKMICASD